MPFICFVPGCKSTFGVGQMHRFPKNKVLFDKWLCLIGHPEMMDKQEYILKNKRICHIHFGPECISPFKRYHSWLKEDAIPTLFLPNDDHTERMAETREEGEEKIINSPVAFEVEVVQEDEDQDLLVPPSTCSDEGSNDPSISNLFGTLGEFYCEPPMTNQDCAEDVAQGDLPVAFEVEVVQEDEDQDLLVPPTCSDEIANDPAISNQLRKTSEFCYEPMTDQDCAEDVAQGDLETSDCLPRVLMSTPIRIAVYKAFLLNGSVKTPNHQG